MTDALVNRTSLNSDLTFDRCDTSLYWTKEYIQHHPTVIRHRSQSPLNSKSSRLGNWNDYGANIIPARRASESLSTGVIQRVEHSRKATSCTANSSISRSQTASNHSHSHLCEANQQARRAMPQRPTITLPEDKSQLSTPQLTLTKPKKDDEDDEEELSGSTSDGEEENNESSAKTAAERLAEKRRMKRFRYGRSHGAN